MIKVKIIFRFKLELLKNRKKLTFSHKRYTVAHLHKKFHNSQKYLKAAFLTLNFNDHVVTLLIVTSSCLIKYNSLSLSRSLKSIPQKLNRILQIFNGSKIRFKQALLSCSRYFSIFKEPLVKFRFETVQTSCFDHIHRQTVPIVHIPINKKVKSW
ncbi:hypothetical protein BpHYR1_017637 [Brachionus plicatilis]|uniref:Uncharacterized protein n=1 Tax=Brachionus plicatilis TaxID=10195 RepID=A0A3M7SE67_BRAPC|nr:hypothetical protein BpHYR1_017637 [Brachionus plicatilis]